MYTNLTLLFQQHFQQVEQTVILSKEALKLDQQAQFSGRVRQNSTSEQSSGRNSKDEGQIEEEGIKQLNRFLGFGMRSTLGIWTRFYFILYSSTLVTFEKFFVTVFICIFVCKNSIFGHQTFTFVLSMGLLKVRNQTFSLHSCCFCYCICKVKYLSIF